jgi:hypothetical protein
VRYAVGERMENSTWLVCVILAFGLGVFVVLATVSGTPAWRTCRKCGSGWMRKYCADCGEKRE